MMFSRGQSSTFSKTISESDVYLFAGICGDFNPVHVNKIEASKSRFGRQIVHGALVNSFISTVLGMYLPGPGTIYISQESTFLKPVYIGDTIQVHVEITEIRNRNRAILITQVFNQDDIQVIEGRATVILPD